MISAASSGEHVARSRSCVVVLITSNVRSTEVVLDRFLDYLQQCSVCEDSTIHQQLQTPVDLCQQLFGCLSLTTEYRLSALEEASDSARIDFRICPLQKFLQLLARIFASSDIFSTL
jgi:hypothetical protein